MATCKHENADHLKCGDFYDDDADVVFGPYVAKCEQLRCLDCGAWLSLGPSNDDDPRVAIEVRAALLANERTDVGEFTQVEWMGWSGDEMYISDGARCSVWTDLHRFDEWEAGGLALIINSHGADDGR